MQENAAFNSERDLNMSKEPTKNISMEKKKKAKRTPKPNYLMWEVLKKAKRKFDAQLSQNNEIKLRCINIFIIAVMSDEGKFWSYFMAQVERLMDSRRYTKECERLHCNPEIIAEHIVFLGSATVNNVLKNGVENTLEAPLNLYTERFTPEMTNIYRDEKATDKSNAEVPTLENKPVTEPVIELVNKPINEPVIEPVIEEHDVA